ncbi:IS21 family transposase [Methylomonas sp. MO1]|uniref:IS21 family transposase n=1 Tax=Methylomonas sp. MO1 TaxID=3073619 RepID=UPI0028A3E03A|nr:IS21 family transposase [Methylomonas sp. MO1]MDT4289551.1 IS21 family transposase [Methylomonas sp. MO1]
MKISITTLRQVIRLLADPDLSMRSIGISCRISPNTVRAVRVVLLGKQLTWADLHALDDGKLYQALFGDKKSGDSRKPVPDWIQVHSEMYKRDMTLQLLWEEYRQCNPEGFSYEQYCRRYRAWKRSCKISLRQIYFPGEYIFVDFCGRTMPIRNAETGEVWFAHVFVGALGASGYLFAIAVASQKIADWLKAHALMLAHLGGVPRYIVPDNLKSAVLQNNKQGLLLNSAYQEFAEHYDFIVMPARPRKPKDKSLGEIGVQIVQRWVLARLRDQVFFSLNELNTAISYWMEKLNERTTRTYPTSRLQRFLDLDAPALKGLREDPYPYSQWRYQVRVDESYHVEYEQHYYSVLYTYAHQQVDIRANDEFLHVYYQRRLIASHTRKFGPGRTTLDEHMPPNHRLFREGTLEGLQTWAQSLGPSTVTFLQRSLEDKRYFASRLKAAQLLRRDAQKDHWQERIESACTHALRLNCLGFDRLRGIISTNADSRQSKVPAVKVIEHENLRGADYFTTTSEAP